VRVAGALVLLFGAALPRIMQLTVDDIDQRGTDTYLNLGDKPAQLPPVMAAMTHQGHRPPGPTSHMTTIRVERKPPLLSQTTSCDSSANSPIRGRVHAYADSQNASHNQAVLRNSSEKIS